MQKTTNYYLNKPELADPADITQLNVNADIIDDALHAHDEEFITQSITNNELYQTINEVNSKIENRALTPFCVNAGALDSNGNPEILGYANDVTEIKELAFVQPVLTGNGTMGGSTFAVYSDQNPNQAYYPFSNVNYEWNGSPSAPTEADPTELLFYNPIGLKVKSIMLQNSANNARIWSKARVYGSNDNSTWNELSNQSNGNRISNEYVTLDVNSNTAYKYHKISFTANYGNDVISVKKISVAATYTGTHTGGRVYFRAPFTATTANGKTFMVGSVYDADVSRSTATKAYVLVNPVGASSINPGTLYKQETQPTNPVSGDLWLKTLEPLSFHFFFADEWHERNDIVIIGEIELDGAGKITKATTYPYNQNGYTVNAQTMATPTTFGVMRTAAAVDETNCQCDDAAITPENMYKLANFRLVNTAYALDDTVAVPYHAELQLKCVNAGTTSAQALDLENIAAGQTITDGTVKWLVFRLPCSVDGVEANVWGDVDTGIRSIEKGGTGANNASQACANIGASNQDLSNLSDTGKKAFLPSDTFINITSLFSTSGGTYTPQANGFLVLFQDVNGTDKCNILIYNSTTASQDTCLYYNTSYSSFSLCTHFPMRKGKLYNIVIAGTKAVKAKFYYAESEV